MSFSKSDLLKKYEKFGEIGSNEIALNIAAKNERRLAKGAPPLNTFVIKNDEIAKFSEIVNNLVINKVDTRFQFIYQIYEGHWGFGEIEISNKEKPNVKILLCDPLISDTKEDARLFALRKFVENGFDINKISTSAKEKGNLKVYIPDTGLQHTPAGCSFHSLLGAFELSNQKDYQDIYKEMEKKHIEKKEKFSLKERFILKNKLALPEDLVVSGSYPSRLLRVKTSLSRLNEKMMSQPEMKKEIINKKGQTFEESLKQHTTKEKEKNINSRLSNKMKKYKNQLDNYLIDSQNGLSTKDGLNIQQAIDRNSFAGLEKYSSNLITQKEESTFSLKRKIASLFTKKQQGEKKPKMSSGKIYSFILSKKDSKNDKTFTVSSNITEVSSHTLAESESKKQPELKQQSILQVKEEDTEKPAISRRFR